MIKNDIFYFIINWYGTPDDKGHAIVMNITFPWRFIHSKKSVFYATKSFKNVFKIIIVTVIKKYDNPENEEEANELEETENETEESRKV